VYVESDQLQIEVSGGTVNDEARYPLASSTADTTWYSELGSSLTRELQPILFGTVYDEPRSDSGISSDESPSSPAETPYSGLESSTREPPPAPVVYDSLAKHDYINANIAATEVMSGLGCDKPQCDSRISLDIFPSPAMETAV